MNQKESSSEEDISATVFSKLANLKQLYESGFIEEAEYIARRNELVNTLTGTTGTSTATATSKRGRARVPKPKIEPRQPPDFKVIAPESAIKHSFDPHTGAWTVTRVSVKLDEKPFAAGSLRVCYYLQEEDFNGILVAKLSFDPNADREIYYRDVEMQMYSAIFAEKFNNYSPPKPVRFLSAWLLELQDREGKPLCAVEELIEGEYRKHNNNYGYVSEDERNTPQAFSHFTYEVSNGQVLICDIQGVADVYTDPQMHTLGNVKVGQGQGNMGQRGIDRFLKTHQCNAICRYLRLTEINSRKNMEIGTMPAKPFMAHRSVERDSSLEKTKSEVLEEGVEYSFGPKPMNTKATTR